MTQALLSRRLACSAIPAVLACLVGASGARATEPGVVHPWVSTAPGLHKEASAYFTNLPDGARITTPYLLKFGLRRYGISPAGHAAPRAGHHHLLVNRDLPLDFSKPLPFNEQYIHFGGGQMETLLDLPRGTYTLRLLLADQGHIPLFVYSKPVTVTVTARHDEPQRAAERGVTMLAPKPGEVVKPPFLVQCHASGLNVSHTQLRDTGVGHFRVLAERAGQPAETINLDDGSTEVWLSPPAGTYRLTLQYVTNADGRVTHSTVPVPVQVATGPR